MTNRRKVWPLMQEEAEEAQADEELRDELADAEGHIEKDAEVKSKLPK